MICVLQVDTAVDCSGNKMMFKQLICILIIASMSRAVHYPTNPTSDISADEKVPKLNKTIDLSEESGHEVEGEFDEAKEKQYLYDAMQTVLNPKTIIAKPNDIVTTLQHQLDELGKINTTLDIFMKEMDNISLDVCKTSQEALWTYVTDINNESKKNKMVRIAAIEDEIKKQYWDILKKKYLNLEKLINDPKIKRKIVIIKKKGTNMQTPRSKQREEIDTMQRIWSHATVCAYNSTCSPEDGVRSMSDVITIFKTSNNTQELAYYWKAYRDVTGKKIRPIFKEYVSRMNQVAESENFTDAGDMWRYTFEDDHFVETVDRIWREIKPLYDLLHDYVRKKLEFVYKDILKNNDSSIPAHVLGNIWAQEWQAIYPKVLPFAEYKRPTLLNNDTIQAKDLFDAVDQFHQSLGFESARDTYQDIQETMTSSNCLPSSYDMCDGANYRIKWCGEKVTDVAVGLARAATLLGHVQYFKHYKNQPPLYRDGPNPAFHDAISDIVSLQLTRPEHLKTLDLVKVEICQKTTLNHLMWVALEKIPLMGYAYVLDKWRWDVFADQSLENWNEHWWDLRINETGVSPPMTRNESDLDPGSKYHVVSHVQYITYLISHVLEFQILLSLCKKANHTGPLHECSIYGVKEAGKLLSDGMALGASEDWRTVLYTITGERELSTDGILQYFSELQKFLKEENEKLLMGESAMDHSAPIIVGAIVLLTLLIIVLYCAKKYDVFRKVFSVCGLSKNGSLDIVTIEHPRSKKSDVDGISEDKV